MRILILESQVHGARFLVHLNLAVATRADAGHLVGLCLQSMRRMTWFGSYLEVGEEGSDVWSYIGKPNLVLRFDPAVPESSSLSERELSFPLRRPSSAFWLTITCLTKPLQ